MNKLLGYGVLAAFLGAGLNVAQADEATTTGGFKIKSSDGNFDASIGGRVHFDGELIQPDRGAKFGATVPGGGEGSSFYFRRVFISLAGHLYGWEYHIDENLTQTNTQGFDDAWVAHSVFGHDTFRDTIYLGQHKPWRSLDELASNNITPFMERNINSGSAGTGNGGVYGGRDFGDGVFYKATLGLGSGSAFGGFSVYTLGKASNLAAGGGAQTQGTGYNARFAYAPFVQDGLWLHVGAAVSSDNADIGGGYGALASRYAFVGRQGPTAVLAAYAPAAGGNNPNVVSVAGELAGDFGPLYAIAEFTNAKFNQHGVAGNDVQAFSGTVGWLATGESRPYDKSVGTYGGVKPKHAFGAVEVAARFDTIRNDGGGSGTFVGATATPTAPPGGTTKTADRAYNATFGVNYYPNPAVRFMLNFIHGSFDLGGTSGKDNANSVEGRVQLVF